MTLALSLKSLWYLRLSRFSPMLSSRSFIVLCFTLTTVIHFELIFVKGVRSVSRFFFLKCGCLVLQHHLLKKKNLVCPLYYLCSSVKEKFTIFVGDYFCILFCVPLISLFVFSPINATLSWLLRLYRKYWGWECQSGFSFSFIIVLVLLSFAFPYKLYFIYLFIKKKNTNGSWHPF